MEKCSECNFRVINFYGYSYCPKLKKRISDIFNDSCTYWIYGTDGINQYK